MLGSSCQFFMGQAMGKEDIWRDIGTRARALDDGYGPPAEEAGTAEPAPKLSRPRRWLSAPAGPPPGRGDALAWLAVAFAGGIGLWFVLPRPPPLPVIILAGLCAAVAGALALMRGKAAAGMLAAVLAGLMVTGLHVRINDTLPLPANAGYVRLQGQVLRIWRSAPGRARVILAVSDMEKVRRAYWPKRAQITILAGRHGLKDLPLPGDAISLRARIGRLPQPAEPGGYDMGKVLWFSGIGASGFAFAATVKRLNATGACARCGPWLRLERALERARRAMAERVLGAMADKRASALALALLTGSRGRLNRRDRERLRAAGLAHILAISGLHLSLVAGAVFWIVRALLAAFPEIALRWPVKKLAAALALLAAFAYLLISGNSVATRRAFIMLAVMTFALMLDRPAITMRNLALAALIILLIRPEMAVRAGFQMSFLAVMGLIAAYEFITWRAAQGPPSPRRAASRLSRMARGPLLFLGGLALSTLIAGNMTSLPVAWHFNRLALYGLAGNILALPLLTVIVMPAGLAALAAMPLGLEGPFLRIMEQGLQAILWWAGQVSAWPHAVIPAAAMRLPAALLIAGGLILLALRRDRWRLAGLAAVLAGALIPPAPRPDVLVEAAGRAVAARGADGLLVPAPGRAGRHVIAQWLRRDGDGADEKAARARKGWTCGKRRCVFQTGGGRIVYLLPEPWKKGKKFYGNNDLRKDVESDCKAGDILISAIPLRGLCKKARIRLGRFDLWRKGAAAIYLDEGRVVTSAGIREGRPWAAPPIARRKVLKQQGRRPGPKAGQRPDTSSVSGQRAGKVRNSHPAN